MNVIRNVSYDDQCPPVGEVIDIQQGVVGCWCVEWGEEENEEIEDEKPAKCHNQACDTFWRFKKTKIEKKMPEQTVRDIWARSSLSVGLAEIAKELAEVNQLSGLSP